MKAGLLPAAGIAACAVFASPNPNLPLDRSRTLVNEIPFRLEDEQRRLIESGAGLSFVYPRPCRTSLDTASTCAEGWRLGYRNPEKGEEAVFRLLSGQEYRGVGTSQWASEVGMIAAGYRGPASFRLDARMFVEGREDGDLRSYDGEAVDFQDEERTGSVSYASYSRYRGDISLDLPFGRLSAARDALHWGPGQFTNLTFHQDAIPFHHFTFSTHLGPFTITSVYGHLLVGEDQPSGEEKSLYAHRYEWRIGRDFLLGLSEQLIVLDGGHSYLFVPIYPLYIAKSFMDESMNNGNLSFDLSYRRPGLGLFYSEFFLDDIESPSSLITKNYRQNKWAWRSGMHMMRDLPWAETGLVLEYSRVEPWVYTHFTGSAAQSTNLDAPLGNPNGPNSQSLTGKTYGRFGKGLYLGLTVLAIWKGEDEGSALFDPYDGARHYDEKQFLRNVEPDYHLYADAGFSWSFLLATIRGQLGPDAGVILRATARY